MVDRIGVGVAVGVAFSVVLLVEMVEGLVGAVEGLVEEVEEIGDVDDVDVDDVDVDEAVEVGAGDEVWLVAGGVVEVAESSLEAVGEATPVEGVGEMGELSTAAEPAVDMSAALAIGVDPTPTATRTMTARTTIRAANAEDHNHRPMIVPRYGLCIRELLIDGAHFGAQAQVFGIRHAGSDTPAVYDGS